MPSRKRSNLVIEGSVTVEENELQVAVGVGKNFPRLSAQHHLAAVQADLRSNINGHSLQDTLEAHGEKGVRVDKIMVSNKLTNIPAERARFTEIPEEISQISDPQQRRAAIVMLLNNI